MTNNLTAIQYNERAFTIDIIGEINKFSISQNNIISKAGGEYTISNGEKKLFPDILLFSSLGQILQGWEMKMPDTSLLDKDLLINAEIKANRLNLNTFLVCNGNEAALYQKKNNDFEIIRTWAPIGLYTREDVYKNSSKWISFIETIVSDLNDFFLTNKFYSVAPKNYLGDNIYKDFVDTHCSPYSNNIQSIADTDNNVLAHIDIWWKANSEEHKGNYSKYQALASCNLINWLNKIFYAHYLKNKTKELSILKEINKQTTKEEGLIIFKKISSLLLSKGFKNDLIASDLITAEIWRGLVEINSLLKDFSNESLPQEVFQQLIEGAINYNRKKAFGQYYTPNLLAKLLCKITIVDKTQNVLDPCCGTGTLIRAVHELKSEINIPPNEIFDSIWLGDVNSLPLQVANMSIMGSEGNNNIFKKNVFDLEPGSKISLNNEKEKTLPLFHSIISNLPFVESGSKAIEQNNVLGKKSDLYANIILTLDKLLEENGRIGVIVSNSWLGTKWGKNFREELLKKFNILKVINSNNGKWFSNTKVVANILILEKSSKKKNHIQFISINSHINDWNDEDIFNELTNHIIIGKASNYNTCNIVSIEDINALEKIGIQWNAYFHDLSWMKPMLNYLSNNKQFLSINRGERGGCDEFFYQRENNIIENQFLQPAVMNSKNIKTLIAAPDTYAFCCSEPIEKLRENNFYGALNHIDKFSKSYNSKGKLWPEVLKKGKKLWYEQTTEHKAHFAFPINPNERIFVAKLSSESLVNQRLGTIKLNSDYLPKINLIHALLNSTFSLLLIEMSGFGRAEGVLDLNVSSLSNSFQIINPNYFTTSQENDIIKAFQPILKRDILTISEELKSVDRNDFDKIILDALNLSHLQADIYKTFSYLIKLRSSVLL